MTGIVTKNFCRPENGFKNEDNLSYNATKGPIRKLIEGFATEGAPVPAFVEIDAWRNFKDGRVRYSDPDEDDVWFWKMVLVLWLIAACIAAWIWYSKRAPLRR